MNHFTLMHKEETERRVLKWGKMLVTPYGQYRFRWNFLQKIGRIQRHLPRYMWSTNSLFFAGFKTTFHYLFRRLGVTISKDREQNGVISTAWISRPMTFLPAFPSGQVRVSSFHRFQVRALSRFRWKTRLFFALPARWCTLVLNQWTLQVCHCRQIWPTR